MPEPMAEDTAHRFEVRTTAESHFSWVRTRLSLERTLMSWVRTAISLIGFGFTIVQFFHYLGTRSAMKPALLPEAPRYFGLALIGTGIIALAISVWQYWWSIGYLRGAPFDSIAAARTDKMHTPILAVCFVLLLIGLFAFVGVLARAV